MRRLIGMLIGCALATLASAAPAQTYPTRPIKLLVSYPPGGASDLIARIFGQALNERLGQPFVVENRPGAAGNLAGEAAAHAEPDGYTLLLGPSALFAINPHLYARMPIDPLKDLLPVASLVDNELVLAANPKLTEGMDFRGFIALAKASNPPLFYASIGNGSEHHLAMELLKRAAGIELTHVPYKGGGPLITDAVAGHVPLAIASVALFSPHIQAGSLRPLAVTSAARVKQLPDVPTIAELGIPNYDAESWWGLLAPAKTSPDIIARMRAAMVTALEDPRVKQNLTEQGVDYVLSSPDAFGTFIADEVARWAKVIKANNIVAGE